MHLVFVLIPLIATFVGMVGAIFSVLGFLRPGRIPRPRRMVNYRVHYDDSLGTSPGGFRRGERPDHHRETNRDRGRPRGRHPAGPPQSHISVSATGEAAGNDAGLTTG